MTAWPRPSARLLSAGVLVGIRAVVSSAIDQQQNPCHDTQKGEQEAAVGDAQAEQWQKVAQDDPHAEQKHALRAVHPTSISLVPPGGEHARRYGGVTAAQYWPGYLDWRADGAILNAARVSLARMVARVAPKGSPRPS